jgi:hypothetical protein
MPSVVRAGLRIQTSRRTIRMISDHPADSEAGPAGMERVAKLLVIVSMAAAISLGAVLGSRVWTDLLPLTIGSFVAAACLSLVFEELSAAVVLFLTYLMPQLFTVLHGNFFGAYGTIWSAALLGVVAPRSIRRSWAVPDRWKAPLILWALTLAFTWPVVAFREFDFTLGLFRFAPYMSPGNGAAQVWVCDVAAMLGLGILWFDWLVDVFRRDEGGFRRWILLPLGASWAITTSVGIYQMFGDMFFLNQTLFGELGRASGTMRDANPYGVLAALGGPALIAAASLTRGPLLRVIAICGIVASWLGLWASGSRTALAAGLIASGFVISAMWTAWAWRASRRMRFVLAILGLLAGAGLMVAVALLHVTSGPLPRLRRTLPTWSVLGFVEEMWNRDSYGMVATHLIREFPLFGVGLGSFNGLVSLYYSVLTGGGYLVPDNAQNWYRHQLVENGLIGSVGWIAWVVLFGWFVMSARAPQPARFAATTVKGTLVALAVVSLVGMPTQNAAVTFTLWTLAFWYVALVGVPGRHALPDGRRATEHVAANSELGTLAPWTWLAIWMIVALSVSGTAYTARYRLRLPQRAQAAGSTYDYGFYDGPDSDVRWTAGKAVDVIEIVHRNEDRYLKLEIGAVAPDAAQRPVEVKVWRDDDLVLRLRRRSDVLATRYICVPPGRKMMRMQVEVSRTWRPSDYGRGTDQRELGVAVGKWTFVYDPPRHTLVVPCTHDQR